MKKDSPERKKHCNWEMLGILTIFLLAIITGYFYTSSRLSQIETEKIETEQADALTESAPTAKIDE